MTEINEHKLFDLMVESNDMMIFEKAVFILNPGGGTFNAKGFFVIWSKKVEWKNINDYAIYLF